MSFAEDEENDEYDLDYYDEDCDNPCNIDECCYVCSRYWSRMVELGFWDKVKNCWTDKAVREWGL